MKYVEYKEKIIGNNYDKEEEEITVQSILKQVLKDYCLELIQYCTCHMRMVSLVGLEYEVNTVGHVG